ncbi:lysine--tRNA ligase [Candidatus Kuenenbacteria bacterium HGW-Kuenenbacteria-1]|uniref:Lysine--tRNA ligase n=1 Tax=Candidatus Kuenenbacteria bacterium HGW-Kuenenbacteria-1 TaxID=2013812 RepID=A0A2N1UN66_9BACT|nr:MAG: lysine--tRNA ligase [Candidatus Kuenenbacteria bacterium HGW-Kuenenbacteria-1]
MSNEKETRLEKLNKIIAQNINPYPAIVKRTHVSKEALADFDQLSKNETKIFLVGRLRSIRLHGGSCFAHLEDGQEKIQLFFRKDTLSEAKQFNYDFLVNLIDIGDFVEVEGILFLTKREEKTLLVKSFKLISKSLRPLPEKWHGIQDEEEKLRKRYLDILFNPEVREMIEKKAKFWNAVRAFLINKNFLEVETPVLETITGGADARPFITHHNALNMDVYLRISMGELWQKRLMVAGFEKTFEIGRQFRNEGMDAEHLQDYTQMEFYWAYADYNDGMKLTEELFKYIAQETFNTLQFKIGKFDIDLNKKWEIYDYSETIKKYTNIDISKVNIKEIEKKLEELNIKYDKKGFNITRAIDNLWKYCRKNIAGPGFLINVPIVMEPLAKRIEKNSELVQRFQIILAGSELGKGYSELNDPIDQAERFADQQKLKDAGDDEAQMFDKDFVEAMEYGMPPICGFGMSERLFSFLMNKTSRECQIFPLMKLKNM